MNWIKEQIEAQRNAAKEEQERQHKQAETEAEKAKKLTEATNVAFPKLIEAIRADVEKLNEAKAGEERFSVRTDDRTTFEFYKIGQAPETRLALSPDPANGLIKYEQKLRSGRRTQRGHVEIRLNLNGTVSLIVKRMESPHVLAETTTSYEELSRFLLSPTF
jgi:hypothetical protein